MMKNGLMSVGATLAAAAGGALLLLAAQPAAAQAHAGSEAEQRACTPDVFRLCMNAIPDDNAIVACLQSKRTLLSPACAEVFADPPVNKPAGKASTARGRRGE